MTKVKEEHFDDGIRSWKGKDATDRDHIFLNLLTPKSNKAL